MTIISNIQNGLFWLLCIAVAALSYRVLFLDMELVMPVMTQHQIRPFALYGHIFLAPIALIALPLQFWKKLRLSRPVFHRWIGRIYAMAVAISGLSGLWLGLTTQSGAIAAWGFSVLAIVWLVATTLAVKFVLDRDFARHRRWMIRSAALTFAAVTLRLMLPIGSQTIGFDAAYQIIAWACWVPNIVAAEWWLRRAG